MSFNKRKLYQILALMTYFSRPGIQFCSWNELLKEHAAAYRNDCIGTKISLHF